MRKLLLAFLLLAVPAFAGSYTITTTAGQDTTLTRAMTRANRQTCAAYGLGPSCTQTQARQEFCRRAQFGGVTTCVPDPTSTPQNPKPPVCTTTPLVSNCAGATQVDVFADVPSFLQREVLALVKDAYGKNNDADDLAAFEAARKAATNAQKNALCAAVGLSNGCLP